MQAQQLKLFQDITLQYFAKLAPGEPPAMEEPFLQFGELAGRDFTSLVAIHSEYDGYLYLSAPRPMLRELLAVNGEPEVGEATLRDMCRELSNVLSGNASQAFGGNWEISVPFTLDHEELARHPLPPSAFVMPFQWRGARSLLVVALAPPDSSSTSIPLRGGQDVGPQIAARGAASAPAAARPRGAVVYQLKRPLAELPDNLRLRNPRMGRAFRGHRRAQLRPDRFPARPCARGARPGLRPAARLRAARRKGAHLRRIPAGARHLARRRAAAAGRLPARRPGHAAARPAAAPAATPRRRPAGW